LQLNYSTKKIKSLNYFIQIKYLKVKQFKTKNIEI